MHRIAGLGITTKRRVRPPSVLQSAGWFDVVRYWSEDEDQIILELYQKLGAKRIARMVDRSPHSIHKRACQLGLANRTEWTRREDMLVRLAYGVVNAARIAQNLSSRTVGSVHARAWRLGLAKERKPWDE